MATMKNTKVFDKLVEDIIEHLDKHSCMRVKEFDEILTNLSALIHHDLIEDAIMDKFDGEVVKTSTKVVDDDVFNWKEKEK